MKNKSSKNTHISDVNEILFTKFVNCNVWSDDLERHHNHKMSLLDSNEYQESYNKAEIAAREFLSKYPTAVANSHWTARPGVIKEITGFNLTPQEYPADVLVYFANDYYLGVSLKCSKNKEKICFKNLGLGTLEDEFGVIFSEPYIFTEQQFLEKYPYLDKIKKKRKGQIRANTILFKEAAELSTIALSQVRDNLYFHYSGMFQQTLKSHLLVKYLNSKNDFEIPYIKITTSGEKCNYKVFFENPLDCKLVDGKIGLEKINTHSILINSGSEKIMRIRIKTDTQPFAASLKVQGEPA